MFTHSVQIAKLLCEHARFMYILKPYLDSDQSESYGIGFVVRFGLNYSPEKHFGPAFALVPMKTNEQTTIQPKARKRTKAHTNKRPRTRDKNQIKILTPWLGMTREDLL